MVDRADAGRQPQPFRCVHRDRRIEHDSARHDPRMPDQFLDPVPLVGDPGNRAELAGRQRRRHRDLRHRGRLHVGRRPERAIRPLDRAEPSIASALRDVVREAQLHRLGAVGDRAPADRGDHVGSGLARHRRCLDHGRARRVRRHPVEHPGAAVAERAPHLFDLVGRAVQSAADHQEHPLGPRRRASSATVSAAGLPKATASIAPKATRPDCSMADPPRCPVASYHRRQTDMSREAWHGGETLRHRARRALPRPRDQAGDRPHRRNRAAPADRAAR